MITLRNPSRLLHTVVLVGSTTFVLILIHIIANSYRKQPQPPTLPSEIDFETKIAKGEFLSVRYTRDKFLGEKIVHFDLKGAPPKVSYYQKLFPLIRELGATGILMEYEDMFPYDGELEELAAGNAYTPTEISIILKAAEKNNLTVIPLVQTFGHLEFLLKHETFRHLRELEDSPEVICPSHEDSLIIIRKMIDQVLEAHPSSTYFHIGCDEVYYIARCPKCQRTVKYQKSELKSLYFNHVKRVAQYIKQMYPHVRPIIWADEILKENEKYIFRYNISHLVDIMVWRYMTTVDSFPSDENMASYAKYFKAIWIASAFKGAQEPDQLVTNPTYHLKNNKGWMYVVMEWETQIHFKGIVLTGWQRFHHFAVLCELLPVAVPSLAMSLHFLQNLNYFTTTPVKDALGCNNPFPRNTFEMRDWVIWRLQCTFPGFQAYLAVLNYSIMLNDLEKNLHFLKRPPFSFYSMAYMYVQPREIKGHMDVLKGKLQLLHKHKMMLQTALREVYDEHTITEWVLTNMVPYQFRLEAAAKMIGSMLMMRTWPRRPMPSLEDNWRRVFEKVCGIDEKTGCSFFQVHIRSEPELVKRKIF